MSQEATQLISATKDGDVATVRRLLAASREGVNVTDENNATPLYWASRNGHHDVVQSLLAAGADVKIARVPSAQGPLWAASYEGHLNVVKMLLGGGANVDQADKDNTTPLWIASYRGHHDVVQSLLAAGADVNIARSTDNTTPLLMASVNGHHDVVQSLLAAGADVTIARYIDNRTPLWMASQNGHHDIVQSLLAAGADVNRARSTDNTTPLYCASQEGHHDVVQSLLAAGADVNIATSDTNSTPLNAASEKGHHDVVQNLLAAGADVNVARSTDNTTSLYWANQNGHHDVVQSLLAAGADVNIGTSTDGKSLLMLASGNNHKEIVEMLLSAGAGFDLQDKNGKSSLMWASENGHKEVVKILLSAGAGVDLLDDNGKSSLMWASENGHKEVIKMLLSAHARVNQQDENGKSSLMWASENGHKEIVKMLLSAHARVNEQDENGKSSLLLASENGHIEVVEMLLSAGAGVDLHDKNGWSSLMIVSEKGHEEVVKMLLSAGAGVDLQDKDGRSSLMMASRNDDKRVVKMLLSAGAGVDLQKEDGKSSLMWASENGHKEVVEMLLSAGARVDLKDEDGKSSLMLASVNGHKEVVEMLLSAGAGVDLQDENGKSSLLLASVNGHKEVVEMLLSAGAGVDLQDEDGDTALHKAAQRHHGECVRLLLSIPGIDVNLVNHKGQTPVKLATNYDVLTLLQKYTTSCEDFPLHTYGKVIMCGDSGAGKSTLTEAIIDSSESLSEESGADQYTASKGTRKPVKPLTAGIISHRVRSPKANMTTYDLAGHKEYYSSHSSILEHISNTTPSIFLLLLNLLLTIKEITAQLYYWSAMIGNVCNKCPQQSSIIVVGTHADCISDEKKLQFLRSQIEQVARDAIKQHIFVQYTALNVTSFRGIGFGSFLSLLYSSIDDVRLRCPAISLTCHVLYAFLNDKVPENQNAVSLSQLLTLLSLEEPKYLPTNSTEVSKHLKFLSEKGFIIFFESVADHVDSWIVFRPEALLEKVNGALFAPSDFNEHLPIASNTGVIPISILKDRFPEPEYNIDMITQFLIRLELCQPFTFTFTSTTFPTLPINSCPDLFFPPLISAIRPNNVTIHNNAFIWKICTTNINQSFSPRFLHVLVLRITDTFPMPAVESCLVPALKPYNRRCTLWRRGISWRSKKGFSTVIEMMDDFRCLTCAVSTSDKTNINYTKHILSVTTAITVACNEFCPSVSRVELITCPPEATLDHTATTVECETLKDILLNSMTTMVDSTGDKEVNIIQWRRMEPQLSYLVGVELKRDDVTVILNEGDHGNIFGSTKSACDKWRTVGRELGFTMNKLDSIVREPGRNGDEDYYEAMLMRWLDWAPPNHCYPSLQTLLSALRVAGKERLANNLAAKYKVDGQH